MMDFTTIKTLDNNLTRIAEALERIANESEYLTNRIAKELQSNEQRQPSKANQ
jgi:hypothetical protein